MRKLRMDVFVGTAKDVIGLAFTFFVLFLAAAGGADWSCMIVSTRLDIASSLKPPSPSHIHCLLQPAAGVGDLFGIEGGEGGRRGLRADFDPGLCVVVE